MGGKRLFVAYEFADPWTSPMLRSDTTLAGLCDELTRLGFRPLIQGPAIFVMDVVDLTDLDPRTQATPVGVWTGGRSVRAFDQSLIDPDEPGIDWDHIATEEEINERNDNGVRDDG